MTALEQWCFACIADTFGALLSYVIILIKMEIDKRKDVAPGKKEAFDERNMSIEIFLFSLVFIAFLLFNMYFWVSV